MLIIVAFQHKQIFNQNFIFFIDSSDVKNVSFLPS